LMKFMGKLSDATGQSLTGLTGVSFAIYKDLEGGIPLWLETLNVQPDASGNYTVLLGSTTSEGIPLGVFRSGEPRWLGLRVLDPGAVESPRVLLTDQGTTKTVEPFSEIGWIVPEFGGMFLDSERETLYVYLDGAGPELAAKVDAAIRYAFGPERPAYRRLEVLPGQYRFQALSGWQDRMSRRVLSTPGVVLTNIDHSRNRLRVGVESMATAPAVEAQLVALDIPLEAVNLEQVPAVAVSTSPLGLDAQPADATTLQSMIRPLVGGIQIEIKQSDTIGKCTLGFPAIRQKVEGFVTAGHCIEDESNFKEAVAYQPTAPRLGDDATNRVGVPSVDPPFFDDTTNKDCPDRRVCRYSDSAFVKLDEKIRATYGNIAQPQKEINWDGKSFFNIVGTAASVKDLAVFYVGAKSGRIGGKITGVNVKINDKESNVTYLNQTEVKWEKDVLKGDSGSPVFAIKDGNNVSLLGILSTGSSFSPIQNIQMDKELGALTVTQ
jgi:Trypsin